MVSEPSHIPREVAFLFNDIFTTETESRREYPLLPSATLRLCGKFKSEGIATFGIMLSYWEKEHFLSYDYIVIGSGIVGLSTALSLRMHKPHASILVLERGLLPTGASTKNAGFACIGSLTEILDDLRIMPEQKILELVSLRRAGLRRLRDRLGDEVVGYAENGSYEIITESEIIALDHFYEINDMLRPLLHSDAFSRADELISQFGFGGDVKHLIRNNHEGELNTGMMMKGLLNLCMESRIEIKTGAEVVSVTEEADEVEVMVEHKFLSERVPFRCGQLAVCTNAFTHTLVPGLDIKPGRGQVLITKPIPGLKIKGVFHSDKGYFYFRQIDGRILFGGGRNMDFAGEQTEQFSYNERILAELKHRLATIILPGTPHEIDYTWTGIMAFGEDKFPIIRQHSSHIFLGVRMGGMGVAMGSEVGEKLAVMITSHT
ncbi:MAG: dependent oxidoreductase [Bacteroidetes bacterium]|nr:dependent oxidoreductase [Bacteroidota bacterium]